MQFVIWGAGKRGKHLLYQVGERNVIAFVDMDNKKQKDCFCGVRVISLKEYVEKYYEYFIIISFLHEDVGIRILNEYGITQYLLLSDCPGEFQENFERKILQNYIKNLICQRKKYCVVGRTLYSFLVYQWIGERCNERPYLLLDQTFSENEISILEKNSYLLKNSDIKDVDNIFVCKYVKKKDQTKNDIVKYIYDCSGKIEEYYNPLIKNYYRVHQNKSCFIVATGSSLRMDDLDTLQRNQIISISMNDIWRAFSKTIWRPNYYIADDYDAIINIPEEVLESNDIVKFLGDTSQEFWKEEHNKKVLKHHFNYEYSENRLPEFSEDFSRQCYMGSTVTYSCIQLAVYLGFKDIYLLGVDFSYAGSDGKQYEHFYEEEQLTSVGFTKQVTLAYKAAKQYADSHGINIYNATRGGKLEIFKRVNFDSLFV